MVIPAKRPCYWTILISLTTLVFLYLTLVNISLDQSFGKAKSYDRGLKKIVAYSLLKQIEIESERYICDGQLNSSEKNYDESAEVYNHRDDAWTNIDGSNLYVSSVAMDRRLDPYHYIRIIGMIKDTWRETLYCQISTSAGSYHTMKVTINPIWSDSWDQNDTNSYFNPVLLSCRVPVDQVPTSVALTTTPCSKMRRNNFRIIEHRNGSQNVFTVCVKPLDFVEDISKRLIQWIEISRLLGADKMEIHVRTVAQNVWRVLKWYNSTYPGEIIIKKFKRITENEEASNATLLRNIWQRRRYEVVAYNNCFYRNIETSRFVIPLDIDEIIVPKRFPTWKGLLNDVFTSSSGLQDNFASFTVPNAYFFGDLSSSAQNEVFFLKNTLRSRLSPAGESGKSFISTKNSLTVFNHYVLDVLRPGLSRSYFLPSDLVQLNHYKETCSAVILPECVRYLSSPRIRDRVVAKFKKAFLDRYYQSVDKMRGLGVVV